MQNDRSRNSRNSKNPLNNSARNKFDDSQEDRFENESSGSEQKDWTREDRGSTEYEKHR